MNTAFRANHLLRIQNGFYGFLIFIFLISAPFSVYALPDPSPEIIEQLEHVTEQRIEAVTILGGDNGAVGGFYEFKTNDDIDLRITKLGGCGIVAPPRALGSGSIKWAPVLKGNLGYMTANYSYKSGYLVGNSNYYDNYFAELGAGARFFFTEHLSTAPVISFIYGHTDNKFKPGNSLGDEFKSVFSGTLVDWEMDTWTLVPSLDIKYTFNLKRTSFEFYSRYNFFHTEDFRSSSPDLKANGNSQTWENKLNVDVPLGIMFLTRELHTGGFIAATGLYGDASKGLNENHIYTVNGRLVLDMLGKIWKTRWIGVGASYFWGDNFSGWAAGADLRLQF